MIFLVCFSGYAHFIRGRQYWKFDPVGMNSLEGYPRYVGMDFFGCSNVWVFVLFCFFTYGESNHIFCFFDNEEELMEQRHFFSIRGWSSLLSLWQCFTPFLIHRSVLNFFSGKLCVSPDLAPPVQLYFHIYFCTFVPARLSSRPCVKRTMQTASLTPPVF